MNNPFRNMLAAGMAILFCTSLPAYADLLQDGRNAFLDYDFDLASELYAKYSQQLKKKPDTKREILLAEYERQLETAENALENVQKIEIIDRIDVPADGFFKAIRLPKSGGKLQGKRPEATPESMKSSQFFFTNEAGDFLIWSEPDDDGVSRIYESHLLLDGSWENPVADDDVLNGGGNARNPFMLSDGATLYYTSDGEGSMGGYDIFVATKEPSTGEYRQPLNLGFPFNSPYDEYMLAIDEENGIGWFVTDRNLLDGKLSIYVYRTSDTRSNYDAEDEDIDIISLARIDDIAATQNPDTNYDAIRQTIASLGNSNKGRKKGDFVFPMGGETVYTTMSDFSSQNAKRLMQQYLQAEREQDSDLAKLAELRKRYHRTDRKTGASTAISNQIKDLETKTEKQRAQLQTMRNSIISAESKNR